MRSVLLTTGDDSKLPLPTTRMVVRELQRIEQDDNQSLAESIRLEAIAKDGCVSGLDFRILAEERSGKKIGWVVWYDSSTPPLELALFQHQPESVKYRECIECGCPQFIRIESIISDKSLIERTVSWFIVEGTTDPSLLWLPAGESIYLAPRSEWKRPE